MTALKCIAFIAVLWLVCGFVAYQLSLLIHIVNVDLRLPLKRALKYGIIAFIVMLGTLFISCWEANIEK
jgi:hypothetical protein